jgi:glucokinase
MLLAGDIGGTKTNLAIFSSQAELHTPLYEETLPSARYLSLEALVQDFLRKNGLTVERACFGVPGPVIEGKAKITNLPWLLDEQQLQETLRIPTLRLVNDLAAMAYAIPLLEAEDLYTLNEGEPEARGTRAIIAPGTGLGEAFLTWEGTHYVAHPSEGGHTDFAPTNAFEIGLLRSLLDRFTHVSYEQVCSGIGIPHLYTYLKGNTHLEEQPAISAKIATGPDPTPIIFQGAMAEEEPSALCVATLGAFASILGAEAGNLALKVMATGGVYLGGGIPPRVLPFLQDGRFLHAFQNKGRLSAVLERIPVHVILSPKSALMGAAYHGFEA